MNASLNAGARFVLPKRSLVSTCMLVGVALLATACARSGQVVDKATGKPLEGVFVMAIWDGYIPGPVGPASRCYDFEITRTDRNGNYRLPRYSWDLRPWILGRHRYQDYYLAGYEQAPGNSRDSPVMQMRSISGDVGSRLHRMESSASYRYCLSRGDRKRKLVPLYRAQAEEARRLAVTPAEKEAVLTFEFAADDADGGQ